MMDGVNLYSIDYYKKTVFKGSYKGLCFRVGRREIPKDGPADDALAEDQPADGVSEGGVEGGAEELIPVLYVQAWKGPYILEKTEEEVFEEQFDYSDEGLKKVDEWLEDKQRELVG